MILEINFPENLITGKLSEQKNIPCVIQVSDKFRVLFSTAVPCTEGIMHEWDRKLLEDRAPARAGGIYTHNEPALITLNKKTEDSYKVIELHIFYNDFGWCPIIINGDYAVPVKFWDSDEDDPGYKPKS
ncbi:hypothetical protein SMX63_003744 [Cronobacter universalis]|nr:hypothetical protein [Cronobacter universalis]